MTEANQEQIAALREQIHRMGKGATYLILWSSGVFLLVALALVGLRWIGAVSWLFPVMAVLAVTHNLAMAIAAELYVKRRRRQVRGCWPPFRRPRGRKPSRYWLALAAG